MGADYRDKIFSTLVLTISACIIIATDFNGLGYQAGILGYSIADVIHDDDASKYIGKMMTKEEFTDSVFQAEKSMYCVAKSILHQDEDCVDVVHRRR